MAKETEDVTQISPSIKTSTSNGLPAHVVKLIGIVRARLRDYPELNRLIAGHETSDRDIALALAEAVDDFNTSPPLIENYRLENFPSVSLLIKGAIIRVLESVGLLQTRNHLVYSDGQGIQVGVSDKAPQIMSWLNMFVNSYEQKKVRLKRALNLKGALNGSAVPSEYEYINGFYDDVL